MLVQSVNSEHRWRNKNWSCMLTWLWSNSCVGEVTF